MIDFNEIPVDMVYLWCDGNDPQWLEKKRNTMQKLNKEFDKEAVSECRFVQTDELKYSLRSLEKYAPWINKIFIITDNQVPKWLNTNNPKIRIVDHKEIMPEDALPSFNASAIETCLANINELSEYFLFGNDDTFFWDNLDKQFFFSNEGKPLCRLRQKVHNKKYKHQYGYMVSNTYRTAKNKYPNLKAPFFPHHNIDAYRKSYFKDCVNEFKEIMDKTAKHQFREYNSIQRSIITYYMIAQNLAKTEMVAKPWYNPFFKEESGYIKCLIKELKKLNTQEFKLLCINDGVRTTDADRKFMKKTLEEHFPDKSEYEL